MTTYRGVLKESNYAGMTQLSSRWREVYLIERTGRFTIGDKVTVLGYKKDTRRDYEYPVLHVQSIDTDSTKTTYRGVLEKSQFSGMTKLKLLFYNPYLDYSFLIERTGRFAIGDSVIVTGNEKETIREYDYPVLHVQSIDGFTWSENSDTAMKTIAGTLRESHVSTLTLFSPVNFSPSYYIERTGNFEIGDEVVITGYVKETRRELRYPLLHVQSIDEFNCCLHEFRGDVNLDGKINLADVIMLSAHFNNRNWVPQICPKSLDINGDSLSNKDDAQYLYDFVIHCGPEPVPCDMR